MRPFSTTYIRTLSKSATKTPLASSSFRSTLIATGQRAAMSSTTGAPTIENTSINTAAGVSLDDRQKTLVGSVLDLFAGRPSLEKLQLWTDEAVFEDPITIAKGRKQYEPQWYGLVAAFSQIERLSHQVTSSGNPITMDMKTRYVVKGIGKEQTISSVVNIFVNDAGKIEKVEDKWNGSLPEGSIANVSFSRAISPVWWLNYGIAWMFWLWSFVWYTRIWRAFRHLNAATVPKMISVPKTGEEDAKKSL